MTAPAPRNHPAEDAQPASTPAPVAVPEGGWRDGDVLIEDTGHQVIRHERVGARWCDGNGIEAFDLDMENAIERDLIVYVHAPRVIVRPEPVVAPSEVFDRCPTMGCGGDARYAAPGRGHVPSCDYPASIPKPVVAPLPSEAVEWRDQLRQAADNRCCQCTDGHHDQIGYIFGTEQDVHVPRDIARRLADLLDRLVPEDDEGTEGVGVLHPLHEACGWQIGPMPDIEANRDFCREQVAEHREACPGKPEDDEDTVREPREATVIRVGRLAGSQKAARELCADVKKGTPVVLDFRDNRTSAPSFVGALLFYATVPPDNTNRVEVVGASPEVISAAEAWIEQSGRVVAGAVTFR